MGHVRLGKLPGTRKWQQVVDLVAEGGDLGQVAAASADAVESGLRGASRDPTLVHSFWLLTQLPLAARKGDFAAALRALGLDVKRKPTLIELAGAFTRAVDGKIERSGGRTDLGEIAQLSAVESLTSLVGRDLPGLFGPTPDDVQGVVAKLASSDRFSVLTRDFVSRLTHRYLAYYLSRELSNHVGPGQRFRAIADHSDFNSALDLHCREASRIIKEISGGWYGKTLFKKGEISPDAAGRFAHVAFKKLRRELRKRRGLDE